MGLSLKFKDRGFESYYVAHFYDEIGKSSRAVVKMASIITVAFCAFDQLFEKTMQARLFELALAVALPAVMWFAVWLAHRSDPIRRLISPLVALLFAGCAQLVFQIHHDNSVHGYVSIARFGADYLFIFGATMLVHERWVWNTFYGMTYAGVMVYRLSSFELLEKSDFHTFILHFCVAITLGAVASWIRERAHRQNFMLKDEVQQERDRNKELIGMMLPGPIAARLQNSKESFAEVYPDVTIIFADLVGFSKLAHSRHPQDLVQLLNSLFKAFDAEIKYIGGEKIKSIGDAYMVAVGCPTKRNDHAVVAVKLALAMRAAAMRIFAEDDVGLNIRFGVHSGMVVAGVLGESKPTFDIWGDTVNIAARLENAAPEGAILISESTWDQTRDVYSFGEKVAKELKGVGKVSTFEVKMAA